MIMQERKTYKIVLNGKEYSELERVLRDNSSLSKQLSINVEMDGRELFEWIICELKSFKKDGIGIHEFGIPVLRVMTAVIYPEDEEYFVRQINGKFEWKDDFNVKIDLKF